MGLVSDISAMAFPFRQALLWIALAGVFAAGQAVSPMPEFEVASVRPAQPPTPGQRFNFSGSTGGPGTRDPGTFTCHNCPLTLLVTQAYDQKRFQMVADRWMDDLRYDVTAKVPDGATKEQFRLMLQHFLAERFKLATHHESKEMDAYELVIGKNGPKFKESAAEPVNDAAAGPPPAPPPPGPLPKDKDGHVIVPAGATIFESVNGVPWAHMNASRETMDSFVARVSSFLRQPVFDATGLKGKYDFQLTWSPDLAGMGVPPPPPVGGEAPPPPLAPDGPTLFGAIQSQLGLKLESRKRQVDMLVLDHAQKVPTEN
jgi:uncharacterized protein (TIGR03435 family)